MCFCTGKQTATIRFTIGPSGSIPLTQENMEKITALGYVKDHESLCLLVEALPGETKKLSYQVINLGGYGDQRDVGLGGLKLVRYLLEVQLGQKFVEVTDNDNVIFYRREDFHQRVLEFEKKQA